MISEICGEGKSAANILHTTVHSPERASGKKNKGGDEDDDDILLTCSASHL